MTRSDAPFAAGLSTRADLPLAGEPIDPTPTSATGRTCLTSPTRRDFAVVRASGQATSARESLR
jgi:hypothetical protein